MSSSEAPGGEPSGLVVVADPEDPVAVDVRDFVLESGHEATVLDVFDAAQLFTITVDGATAVVEPALPMFLRLPAPPLLRTGFDAEFHLNECLAHLWAVAALTPAPVINRPEPGGLGTRVSASAALTELRAGLADGSPEIFSAEPSGPPGEPPGGQGTQWWIQDLGSWTTRPWPELPDPLVPSADCRGPYRARWSDPEPLFESVVVLGGQAWRSSPVDLDGLGLEERSTEIGARLGLQLSAVVWRLSPDLTRAWPVVVEPFPDAEQLRMVWLGLGPQLVKVLFP
ncbi:hypothetical protein J2Z21_005134 [Streptomyces griseochromogenes]|uniref:Uncharacterized protein n=1 Tax=Streptomyces griseochromogenes TaxID=68214 RepID=A0A1B1AWL8_9ACTN|nr:hypothetical protein [Streptomyces griseochromogenes]ANP50931.1 hypothetical protein AVL59_16050 [Streptomyces griseochromogenes]MBP2052152.1 hypothetical protein [Streptomyces griseochromogenes]